MILPTKLLSWLLKFGYGNAIERARACVHCALSYTQAGCWLGNGAGTYISEALRDEYPSTCILSNCIWPHESGEVIVQSYNVLLTLSYLESLADGIVILQNEGLTSICKKLLGIQRPSFDHMNEVAAESLVSVLLPAFWRPVEATLSPQKENTHRLTHPIIQTGDNKPNNSGKFVASSHLHLLSDLVSVLCAHPAYRLLSLRFTPQASHLMISCGYICCQVGCLLLKGNHSEEIPRMFFCLNILQESFKNCLRSHGRVIALYANVRKPNCMS